APSAPRDVKLRQMLERSVSAGCLLLVSRSSSSPATSRSGRRRRSHEPPTRRLVRYSMHTANTASGERHEAARLQPAIVASASLRLLFPSVTCPNKERKMFKIKVEIQ